MAIVTKTCFI